MDHLTDYTDNKTRPNQLTDNKPLRLALRAYSMEVADLRCVGAIGNRDSESWREEYAKAFAEQLDYINNYAAHDYAYNFMRDYLR